MNDCITTTKQSTTKPCAYFLGYTVQWIPACVLHGFIPDPLELCFRVFPKLIRRLSEFPIVCQLVLKKLHGYFQIMNHFCSNWSGKKICWSQAAMLVFKGNEDVFVTIDQGAFQKRLWALKSKSFKNCNVVLKLHFLCTDNIFCVEFQRVLLKFHTKLSNPYIERSVSFILRWKFKSF